MRKTELTPEEVKWTAERIVKAVNEQGGKFQFIIHSTSRSNLSYTYSLYMWSVGESGIVEKDYLNYWFAFCMGQNLTDNDKIKGNGLGFRRSDYALRQLGDILDNLGLEYRPLMLESEVY